MTTSLTEDEASALIVLLGAYITVACKCHGIVTISRRHPTTILEKDLVAVLCKVAVDHAWVDLPKFVRDMVTEEAEHPLVLKHSRSELQSLYHKLALAEVCP